MAEKNFQSEVASWLRKKRCFVIITTIMPGVPTGTPDIIALFPGGGWAALEIKPSARAKFRPLQEPTIAKLNDMFYSRAVYPENWEEIKAELAKII